MSTNAEIDRMIMELEGEVRRFRGLIDALEEPATVAAEPDDLHPVALLLAQAYRLAWEDDTSSSTACHQIRLAWVQITGEPDTYRNAEILAYGLPK